jgi:membrane protein YdbS with pleckstrin-like domain
LDGFLWISFILFFIGVVDAQRLITFNNWASWGFFIGTILMFILAMEVIDQWMKYNKNKKCQEKEDLATAIV